MNRSWDGLQIFLIIISKFVSYSLDFKTFWIFPNSDEKINFVRICFDENFALFSTEEMFRVRIICFFLLPIIFAE